MSTMKWLEESSLSDEVKTMLPGEPTENPMSENADNLVHVMVSMEQELGEEILETTQLEKQSEELELLLNASTALEAYLEQLNIAESNGGMRREAVSVMAVGLKHLDSQLKFLKQPLGASLESFYDGRSALLLATGVSQESLGESLKALGQRILQMLKELWDRAADAWQRYRENVEKVRVRALAIIESQSSPARLSGNFDVPVNTYFFAGGKFCADQPAAVDTILDYLETGYYYDLGVILEHLERTLDQWVTDRGSLYNALFHINLARRFPGKHSGVSTSSAGVSVDKYAIPTPLPDNRTLVLLWPTSDGDGSDLAQVFNNIRFQMEHIKAAPAPSSYQIKAISGADTRQRLTQVIQRLERIEQLDMAQTAKPFSERLERLIVRIESKYTTELTGDTTLKNIITGIINGLQRLSANQAPAFNGIYAYLAKVYASQVRFAEIELHHLKAGENI